MPKLYFASLVTLSLLAAMLIGVFLAAMVALGQVDLGLALILTLVINAVLFVISPFLTDLMLRWINKLEWLDEATVRQRYPHVYAIIHEVAREYGFTAPFIGFIPDRNPTAFTYGILRSNARIVLTQGIFEVLNEEETRAVVAHELGHIVNRDFLVMTVAGMLVQMMYQVYAAMRRASEKQSGKKDKGGAAVMVAVAAYIAYILGEYILLYLSRTREYLADSFSAERVEARHLASALVKVAYGIARIEDTDASRELLASTRHLGIVDVRNARHFGLVAEAAAARPEAAAEAMLFDIYNPWAKLIEIGSTHPLTGHRIQHLATIARDKRQRFDDYDVEGAARRKRVDPAALRRKFASELVLLLMPYLAGALVIVAALASEQPALAVLALPAGLIVWAMSIPRRFPFSDPARASVADLMGDVAASPVVGRAVRLDGEVIGRADAGSIVGEDTVFADRTGRIIVDFRSLLAGLGDLWTGWRRIAPHIGQKGHVEGWFRRTQGGFVIMSSLETGAGRLTAKPYLQGIVSLLLYGAVIVCVLAFLAYGG
jgi:Zn-dependent protease with chaperone function